MQQASLDGVLVKKPSGYVAQHFDGESWRTLTKPVTNKKYAFAVKALAVNMNPGVEYRVLNRYTNHESRES